MVVPEKLDLARCAPGATIGWVDLILSPALGLSIDVVVVVRLRPVDPALQLAVLRGRGGAVRDAKFNAIPIPGTSGTFVTFGKGLRVPGQSPLLAGRWQLLTGISRPSIS